MSRYTILKKSIPFKIRWDSLIKKKGYKSAQECMKDEDVRNLWLETCDENLYNYFSEMLSCCMCGKQDKSVRYLRQNTQYAEDYLNYVQACPECFEEIQTRWDEQWKDYWSGIGKI